MESGLRMSPVCLETGSLVPKVFLFVLFYYHGLYVFIDIFFCQHTV